MTDVAAVSGNASTNAGTGSAKGSAAKGAGTGMDGAFAAIFGAAGGKNAGKSTDESNVKPAAQAKPAAQTLDPALTGETTAEVDPQAVLAGAGAKAEDASEAETATTLRKPATRRKADTDQADGQAISAMAQFAALITNAPQASPGKPVTVSTVSGVQSVGTAAPVTTDVAIAANAADTIKPDGGKTDPGTDIGKDTKPAAVAAAQPQVASTQAASAQANSVAVDTAGQQGGNAPDSRNGNGNDPAKDQNTPAAPQQAANDADALQTIMQSLPPGIQSQLNVADIGSSAMPAISMSDQLNNQVIDMGVSGQWIDRMAREIATLASGTGNSSFQLSPPNLGKIQVDLMQSGGVTNVRILTETDEATQRLREGQSALEANARVASLSLGSVSVEKAPASHGTRDQNTGQNPDSAGNGQQQQQASAQAQGQSGQNRNGAGINRSGFTAVMGQEQEAETDQAGRADRVTDPGVRFA